jgi:hypothetical protein
MSLRTQTDAAANTELLNRFSDVETGAAMDLNETNDLPRRPGRATKVSSKISLPANHPGRTDSRYGEDNSRQRAERLPPTSPRISSSRQKRSRHSRPSARPQIVSSTNSAARWSTLWRNPGRRRESASPRAG